MPSAPPAERRGWARRATLAAITVGVTAVTYHALCAAIFDCGCSWIFAGGTVTCDIHVPGPPDCPVCTNVSVGIAFSAALIAAWGTAVGFAARRFLPRDR
jgi:hypothetical protein